MRSPRCPVPGHAVDAHIATLAATTLDARIGIALACARLMLGVLYRYQDARMNQTLYDIPVTRIEGGPATLADYRGKVLLVVNVASKCGLTPQYEGLEALYRDKRAQGLEVLAFPANDFNGQEPGSEAEIAQFCRLTYDVTFPMFAKIAVTGEQAHPLYQALTSTHPHTTGDGPMREKLAGYGIAPNPAPGVLWNFEKFLIGRDGKIIDRFAPDIPADDARLLQAIDAALVV